MRCFQSGQRMSCMWLMGVCTLILAYLWVAMALLIAVRMMWKRSLRISGGGEFTWTWWHINCLTSSIRLHNVGHAIEVRHCCSFMCRVLMCVGWRLRVCARHEHRHCPVGVRSNVIVQYRVWISQETEWAEWELLFWTGVMYHWCWSSYGRFEWDGSTLWVDIALGGPIQFQRRRPSQAFVTVFAGMCISSTIGVTWWWKDTDTIQWYSEYVEYTPGWCDVLRFHDVASSKMASIWSNMLWSLFGMNQPPHVLCMEPLAHR